MKEKQGQTGKHRDRQRQNAYYRSDKPAAFHVGAAENKYSTKPLDKRQNAYRT